MSKINTQQGQELDAEEEDLLMTATLSPLRRLIKFSQSTLVIQRLVVAGEIYSTIREISIEDAVNIALPIITELAKDTEDSVKESLAAELDKIIYYYYQNAPPIIPTIDSTHSTQSHIPQDAFAPIIIEFLLDQNTTLASVAQQAIVTVAAELADTPQTSDKYKLHQALIDEEIMGGVVSGLIGIFNGDLQNKKSDDDKQKPQIDNEIKSDDSTAEHNMNITLAEPPPPSPPANEEDIVEKILPEETSVFETPFSTMVSSATNSLTKNYDNGGVNLAKMVCLMLMSALAPVFGSERCIEKILPIVESMATDPMFYVRKEAATAVGSLATTVSTSVTLDRLLPLYLKLSVDNIWHVRRSCVFTLPLLCEVLPEDMKTTIAIEGVELFKNDASRNVRNSLIDITGEIISKFLPHDWKETGNPGQVPEELLDFFLSLGITSASNHNQMYKADAERIHNCAYNFPAVVLTAGVGYWDSHLKDTYLSLTKDYQSKVRRTFAFSLHEIARTIGPERTERDLVQIFALYLMDMDDVKQGVLEHLSEFLAVLAPASRNEYIPILTEVWDGVLNNWHLRDALTNQLRDIARLFDASRVVQHVLPLAIKACQDEFAAIRETGVEIFPVILDIVKRAVDEDGENLSHPEVEEEDDEEDTDGNEHMAERQQRYALALLNHVMEKLDELVKSPSHRTRLVFAYICGSLLEAGINPADFASFFLPRLAILAKDPVVNVRIATSRTLHVLCSIKGYQQEIESIDYTDRIDTESELSPGECLGDILYCLAVDRDQDVRSYISEFVSEQDLAKRREVESLNIATSSSPSLAERPPQQSPPTPPAHLIAFTPPITFLDNDDEDFCDISSPMEITVDGEEDEMKEEHNDQHKEQKDQDTAPSNQVSPNHQSNHLQDEVMEDEELPAYSPKIEPATSTTL